MASFSEKNYLSVNTVEGAAEKDWSLTGVFKKSVQQATVKLSSGKEYEYASRWPFKEGDVAIIGNTLIQNSAYLEQSSNSGLFGIITHVEPKLTIKRNHAVELDYVFTVDPSKKSIADCVKYLESPQNFATVQYGKFSDNYFPLSFYIRRLLAAASIIAHPDLTSVDAIEEAKKYIKTKQDFDKMEILTYGPWYPGLYFNDTQIDTNGKSIEELEGYGVKPFYDTDEFKKSLKKKVNSYLNKYALIGAISVMVRGGFINLLDAFLSANPPIQDYYDELTDYLGETGNPEALSMIKRYGEVVFTVGKQAEWQFTHHHAPKNTSASTKKGTKKDEPAESTPVAEKQAKDTDETDTSSSESQRERIERLIQHVDNIDFEGKNFAFIRNPSVYDENNPKHPLGGPIMEKGGLVKKSVSGKTNYFIVWPDDKYSMEGAKGRDALAQIDKGKPIIIISVENLKELL